MCNQNLLKDLKQDNKLFHLSIKHLSLCPEENGLVKDTCKSGENGKMSIELIQVRDSGGHGEKWWKLKYTWR